MTEEAPRTPAVWEWPLNSRKAHLFPKDADGAEIISLCRKWMHAGRHQQEWNGTSGPDDCRACVKKAEALDKKLAKVKA